MPKGRAARGLTGGRLAGMGMLALAAAGCSASASSVPPSSVDHDAGAKPSADAGVRGRDAAVKETGATDAGAKDSADDVSASSEDATSDRDAAIADAAPVLPTLPAAVIAAGCTESVFFDDFNDLHTVDMQDTRAAGFNWYRYNPASGNSIPAANVSTVHDGTVTALRFSADGGGGLLGATRSTAHGPVGYSFSATGGKCTYIEGRVAMALGSSTATSWPAFWALATQHMQSVPMQWQGDPAADYEHYIEIDIMELTSRYSDNARSTLIDWYGNYSMATPDCNMLHYCKVQNSQGLGPNVAGTYDSLRGGASLSSLWRALDPFRRAKRPAHLQHRRDALVYRRRRNGHRADVGRSHVDHRLRADNAVDVQYHR